MVCFVHDPILGTVKIMTEMLIRSRMGKKLSEQMYLIMKTMIHLKTEDLLKFPRTLIHWLCPL